MTNKIQSIIEESEREFEEKFGRGLDFSDLEISAKEKKIIEMRNGTMDGFTHTLEEVGKAFGVTRERIRQIEAKIMEKNRQKERVKSHLHQSQLKLLAGIREMIEGKMYKNPGYYTWTQGQHDEAQAGKMAEWAKKIKVGEERFSSEMEEFEKPYNQALQDLLSSLPETSDKEK